MNKTAALYGADHVGSSGETNDCGVRAVVAATGLPYAQVNASLIAAGRKPRQGTYATQIDAAGFPLERLGGGRRLTITQFIKRNPTGRYVILRRGHYFAVIAGVVHDWWGSETGPRSRVVVAWKVIA